MKIKYKMKNLLIIIAMYIANAQAAETITIKSNDLEDDLKKWVLVDNDCENSETKCNQIYVEKNEVGNYKNKKIIEEGMQSRQLANPSKTDLYKTLDNYFNVASPPDKIYIWVLFSENAASSYDYENNKQKGKGILANLDKNSYELNDGQADLEMGYIPIKVNRKALADLYHNNHVISFDDPTLSTYK